MRRVREREIKYPAPRAQGSVNLEAILLGGRDQGIAGADGYAWVAGELLQSSFEDPTTNSQAPKEVGSMF
jgi:hypothetical protein